MDQPDVLHVEVSQKITSALSVNEIERLVQEELNVLGEVVLDAPIEIFKNEIAQDHIKSVICSYDFKKAHSTKLQNTNLKFHIYRLTEENAAMETMQNGSENLSAYAHWILPTTEFEFLWENLHFPDNVKLDLLHFVETIILFSDCNINPNIISSNKIVFLHGPPGTGKTSLCKALAQKAAIRLSHRFSHVELVEINSNSLFSKWFSESGKLVMKLFDEIRELLKNPQALVCILINELESLALARETSTGSEPSDAIRVVNALLTQVDLVREFPNVVILTTSNLSATIDEAFIDRVDIMRSIGYPDTEAIYRIYKSCLEELMRTGIIKTAEFMEFLMIEESSDISPYVDNLDQEIYNNSKMLKELSHYSVESKLSGRMLRKIPFLTQALHIRTKESEVSEFLTAMKLTIQSQ